MAREQKISNGVNKKNIVVIIVVIILGTIAVMAKNNGQQPNANVAGETANETQMPNIRSSADKIEVVHFHATQQCWSCITIGKYAGETVSEFFQPETRDGKIEFREINVDLPENKNLARKFQAGGSSLFINAIYGGKDHIAEDTQVWRLISNETQFKSYLKNKLNNLFGK